MRARNARSEDKPGRSSQRGDAGTGSGRLHGPAPTRQSPCPLGGGPADWTPADVLALQRSAGNAVVARLLGEEEATGPVQRSGVPDVLRSPGTPLAASVRADMESRLGADFSDVRLHSDAAARASAAELGARAYTSGSHIVVGEGGADRHTLAHELTHVIQQRQGPVSGTDDGRGLRVSDPSDRFEREAEATATRALAAPPAGAVPAEILDADAGLPSPARVPVQRFVIYDPGDERYPALREKKWKGSKEAEDPEKFFPSQHENEAGKFTDISGNANIQYHNMPPLQISDNLDLAVEHNVEAKYFYATEGHIAQANKRLKGKISFKKGSKLLQVTLDDEKKVKLYQVIPTVKVGGKKREGLDVTTSQRCNEMAEQVTGQKGVQHSLKGEEYIAKVLDEATGEGDWLDGLRGSFARATAKTAKKEDQDQYFDFKDLMVTEFTNRSAEDPEAFNRAIKSLFLNEHLRPPLVGDVMATQSMMTEEERRGKKDRGEDFFEYHFGGVVAVSDDDFVTMENYARGKDAVSGGDPLFFFKMYGPARTWHAAQQATGSFFGAVISMIVEG